MRGWLSTGAQCGRVESNYWPMYRFQAEPKARSGAARRLGLRRARGEFEVQQIG